MLISKEVHQHNYQEILKDIYSDKEIASVLGFKGGTAAYLFYDLPRFSVDLDFDLLDPEKEDIVFERLQKILTKYGDIKENYKKHFTIFFQLTYGVDDHNIKVEVSRRNSTSKYGMLEYFGIAMLVMDKPDMFANKLLAMLDRLGRSNRDIFDVWYFAKNNWSINQKLVEDRSGKTLQSFLDECILKLTDYPEAYILDGLGLLLETSQKDWAKVKLKQETIYYLQLLKKRGV